MPQNTNLTNVHADVSDKHLVQARIDAKVFDYFFRHCLTGDRGPRQAFITFFYQRFYEACVLDGIAPVWDESNEQRINAVLQRLNFLNREEGTGGKRSASDSTGDKGAVSGEPTCTGRTDTPPAVDTHESAGGQHDDTTTHGIHPTFTHSGDVSANPIE